jgi:AcrR family transcriptional regulator
LITDAAAPTRERILDAAVELFGRGGYSGTSVGDIERAAGLVPRRGGLYKHFASKEALLEAAVERRGRAVDELESLATTVPLAPDAREEVRVLIRIAFREIGRDQEVLRIVMREGDNFPELRDRFYERIVRSGHAQTAERLRLLAERAGVAGLDVEALAAVLLAPIISYRVIETLFGRAPGDLDEHRYLDTWTASAVSLLEAHGLVPGAPTKEERK